MIIIVQLQYSSILKEAVVQPQVVTGTVVPLTVESCIQFCVTEFACFSIII